MIELSTLIESITNQDRHNFNTFIIDKMLSEDKFVKVLDELFPSKLHDMELSKRQEYISTIAVGNTGRNFILFSVALRYLQNELDKNAQNFLDIARLDKYQNIDNICNNAWKDKTPT